MLRQFIREAAITDERGHVLLTSEIVDFLVRFYAGDNDGNIGDLKWYYDDFGTKGTKDGRTIGGMYVSEKKTLLINRQDHQDLFKKVRDVLHEIQHFNQHMDWKHGDDAMKMAFVKGKKFPKGVDEADAVYNMSFDDLVKAWVKIYGYDNSPHEVDARRYAAANGREAMGYIKQHFL